MRPPLGAVTKVAHYVFLLIAVTLSGCSLNQDKPKQELLIAWGQHEYNGDCSVWLIDPVQKVSNKVLAELKTCNFLISNIGDTQHLIYRESPGKMIIYTISTADTQLSIQEVVTLNGIETISSPQWDRERTLYFSSAVEGVEQIFRVEKGTSVPVPFIKNDAGLAADPIISPDGRFLTYWTLDGPMNRTSKPYCLMRCVVGYFHVFDLKNNRETSLLPLIEPTAAEQPSPSHHENAHWSPTGQFLAFQISVFGAGGIAIYDTGKPEIVAHLHPDRNGGSMEIIQWTSATAFVYMADHYFSELGYALARPYLYSLDTNTSWELLPDLPAQTADGAANIFYDFDASASGKRIVGVLRPAEEISLLIADIAQDKPGNYTLFPANKLVHTELQLSPFTNPLWSISGEWVAYYAEYSLAGSDRPQNLANLHLISKTGEEVSYTESVTEVLAPSLQYAWIQSR